MRADQLRALENSIVQIMNRGHTRIPRSTVGTSIVSRHCPNELLEHTLIPRLLTFADRSHVQKEMMLGQAGDRGDRDQEIAGIRARVDTALIVYCLAR